MCHMALSIYFSQHGTADSNGSDVIWNAGTITNDVVGTGRINVSAYNNKSGVYVTHIYAV